MSDQSLKSNTDVLVRTGATALPPGMSLKTVNTKNTDEKTDELSLLGTMQALSQVTDLVSAPKSASAEDTTSTETDETPTQEQIDETDPTDSNAPTYDDVSLIDFSTAAPSTGGLIGGSVVGVSSKYLLDQQQALLAISLSSLAESANANYMQGVAGRTQLLESNDAANNQYRAGMMQASSEFTSGAIAGGAGVTSLYYNGSRPKNVADKDAQVKECDNHLELLNNAKKPDPSAHSGTSAPVVKPEVQAKQSVIQKAFKENDGVVTDKHIEEGSKGLDIHSQKIAEAKTEKENARTTHGERSKEYDEASNKLIKLENQDPSIENPKLFKEMVRGSTDANGKINISKNSKGEYVDKDVEHAVGSIADADKPSVKKSITERRDRASTEANKASNENLSFLQMVNMFKDLGMQFAQGAFKVPQTIYEKKSALEHADAQLFGTVSSQYATAAGGWNSFASKTYDQAMSTMQGTMDALRRAANPN